jgi:hypothetical protein
MAAAPTANPAAVAAAAAAAAPLATAAAELALLPGGTRSSVPAPPSRRISF